MPRAAPLIPLPVHTRGQRIGLFGGSFNPPHAGHVHVVMTALKRLRLDWVWVLVTPGNPLKAGSALAPLDTRMAALRALLRHPKVIVTDIEARANLTYSCDTIALLRRRLPATTLIWLMGADNLASFHRWKNWRAIAQTLPIAIIDRPGASNSAVNAPAARFLSRHHIREDRASMLRRAPALAFLHARLMPHSSTTMRNHH